MTTPLLLSILAAVCGLSALAVAGWCWANRPAAQFRRISKEYR